MKRIYPLILALIMMALVVACGGNSLMEKNNKYQEVMTDAKVDEEPKLKVYTVTFKYNFGERDIYKTVEVEAGETIESPVEPQRKDYDFAGWYIETSGEKFDFDTIISQNINLQAKWEKSSLETVATIVSSKVNISVPTLKADESTSEVNVPTLEVSKTTSEINESTSEVNVPIPEVNVPAPESKVYYRVNFDANGGTVSSSYIKVESDSAIGSLPEASRDGYTFLGWYTEAAGGAQITTSTKIIRNMTVYAHWIAVEIGDGGARITFDKNDGSRAVYQVQHVPIGEIVTEPVEPARELYRFTGWYLEPAATTKYDFTTPVTDDFTLYAGWGNPDGTDDGIYAASNTTETIFSITDIFVENNEVTVTYNTNNVALVTVEFFEDQMLNGTWTKENLNANLSIAPTTVASGYTETYGELATITIPIASELPEYFLIRAKMSDSESNSTEYVSSHYTKTFAEFNALTVDDFEEEKVINFDDKSNTNFGVIKDSVIVLPTMSQYGNGREFQVTDIDNPQVVSEADEPQMENLVPDQLFTFPDKNAVISTREDGSIYTLSDLIVGDVVYVEGTTWMFKIKDIYENADGTISFTADSDVTMTDFYDTLKVDFEGIETEVSDPRMRWDVIDVNGSGSITFEPYEVEKDLPNGIDLEGSVSGKVTGNVTLLYDVHLFSENYFESSFTFVTELNGEISAGVIDTNNANEYKNVVFQVDTRKVKLPTPVTGLNIYIKPSMQINWGLSGDVSIAWTSKQTSGFKYNSDIGRTDIKEKENTVSIMAKGKAEAKVGPIIDIGVELLNGVLSGGVVAEAGAKVSAEAEIGADDLLNNADFKHACGLCVAGRADWYAKAFVKCGYKITEKLTGDIVSIEILNFTAPLTFNAIPSKFFVSVINSTDSPFGGHWKLGGGECTNKTYRTEIITQDQNGQAIDGSRVSVIRTGQTTEKSGTTPYVVYLYNGTYKAHSKIGGFSIDKSFVVNNSRQTVALNKNSVNTVLEGTVVDASTKAALSGVSVKVSVGDIVVATTETNTNGKFKVSVPTGSLKVDIAPDNYLPFRSTEVIHEGDTIHSMGQIELTPGAGMGGFHGIIRDAVTNQPVGDVTLNLYKGWNNPAESNTSIYTLKTDENGVFRYRTNTVFGSVIGLASGNYTLVASKEGYTDTSYNIVIYPGTTDSQPEINETMSPVMVDGDYRIVLTWSVNPRDLDSHLVAETLTGETIHVFYANKDPYPHYANLDIDDVDGEGPETITITNFSELKNIRYAVHDFTNHWTDASNELSKSEAVVRLYKGNQLLRTFNVPTGYDGTEWDVFSLNTNGGIETLNTMTYSDPNNVLSGVRTLDLERTYKDYELNEIEATLGEENLIETPKIEENDISEIEGETDASETEEEAETPETEEETETSETEEESDTFETEEESETSETEEETETSETEEESDISEIEETEVQD